MNLKDQLPTQEWVDNRKDYIGGSDVSSILQENPYSTPLQVWMRKKGLLAPIDSSPIMDFGHYFEPILAARFEEVTGLKTRQVNKTYEDSKHSFLRANIDRMVLASGAEPTAVLELKTTTSHRIKALGGEYPKEYILQVQHYLGITGYSHAYLQCYERDTCKFHDPVLIERDDDLIIENMSKLIKWWNVHMIGGKRPEPINGEDCLILYPDSSDGTNKEATPGDYALYNELLQIRERKEDVENMEEYLKTKLKERIGESEMLSCGGKPLIKWKSTSQNRLDTNAIRKAHPELCKSFTNQTKTRRFTVH
ncbi:MAG: YqaJ viral recombinase family protein [Balneola sp.]